MANEYNDNMPKFEDLDDRVIAEGNQKPSFSMNSKLDPKDPTEDNPYFDKTKNYSKEELEKFKKFFGGI
ncbi:hypothetical protein NC661_10780 [Aquibacillus koreensis]|uniref:Uncharacterized protein n=1 Tax=Aquibacillus koreensis TaxID=279446 RepID=A0A9X3WP33_9BACI|nr:hypothetical protein [Aquibacillus koreensis]MCT2538202.1 hypothetical protein [Aquibacillus koreensis]MDC3420854.1 hypothetical protein [Aquibacillus koreensis]